MRLNVFKYTPRLKQHSVQIAERNLQQNSDVIQLSEQLRLAVFKHTPRLKQHSVQITEDGLQQRVSSTEATPDRNLT